MKKKVNAFICKSTLERKIYEVSFKISRNLCHYGNDLTVSLMLYNIKYDSIGTRS